MCVRRDEFVTGWRTRSTDPLEGAIWDQALLDAYYAGTASYLHGHSVGGTNPSLLRAIARRAPALAFDCPYNRETTGGAALWWRRERDIVSLLADVEAEHPGLDAMVERAWERAARRYVWPDVIDAYEKLLDELAVN